MEYRRYCPLADRAFAGSIGTLTLTLASTSQVKVAELRVFMKENGISILCIQETHVIHTDHYIEDGFSIFLSGAGENVSRSYAGVGFIVAPWAIAAVVSFKAISDRLANLRVKVTGGVLNLVTAYAPHDGYDFNIRHDFFSTLCQHTRSKHLHETSMVLGDLNAQFGYVGHGEEAIVGQHVFKKTLLSNRATIPNRTLVFEYCATHDLMIANTFFNYPDEVLVSYYNLNGKPTDLISSGVFSQLDHVFVRWEIQK